MPDIEFSVSPIGNYASGGAIIEFRDVTEQKQIENERMNALLMTEQQSSVSPMPRRACMRAHRQL